MAGSTYNKAWSADGDFLNDMVTLRRRFMDCVITQDLTGAVGALKLLFYIAEPKLQKYKPTDEYKEIKWIEDNLSSITYIDGMTGRPMETDGTRHNKRILLAHAELQFRNLLMKLQKAGIYTRNITESRDTLGDFDGS